MKPPTRMRHLAGLVALLTLATVTAAELPGNFPGDVPIADYMQVTNVTVVRDSMMVSLHAPGKTIADVAGWFQSGLAANGWKSEGEQVSERNAILAYKKNGRRCGVSITNFVMNEAMQMDDSIKGITLQVSGAEAPAEEEAEAAGEATMDATTTN